MEFAILYRTVKSAYAFLKFLQKIVTGVQNYTREIWGIFPFVGKQAGKYTYKTNKEIYNL